MLTALCIFFALLIGAIVAGGIYVAPLLVDTDLDNVERDARK